MRVLFGVLAFLFFLRVALASEIREFSIATLERLGTELYHRDQIAARAADLVVEQHPEWKTVKPQGWITDLHKNGDAVYLIAEAKSGLVPAYKVTFPRNGSLRVDDIHGQKLPREIALRYKARTTALAALNAQTDPFTKPVTAVYNFEVLVLPPGQHVLSVSTTPQIYRYTAPTQRRVNAQPGKTYAFTAFWKNSDEVYLEKNGGVKRIITPSSPG